MKIKTLKLYTHQLSKQKNFFINQMGFKLKEETKTSFSFQVGYSIFQFEASAKIHQYHYCFLIPCNQLDASIQWLEAQGIKVIEDEDGRRKHRFESWNADTTYFYDALSEKIKPLFWKGNLERFIRSNQAKILRRIRLGLMFR